MLFRLKNGFNDISNTGERVWASLFHSISAYNNAGFGLWTESMQSYRTNWVVNLVIINYMNGH